MKRVFSITFILPTKPILTRGQIERMSNICDGAGQVLFGIMVVSPLVSSIDKLDITIVVLGLISVLFCWAGSIYLARDKDL